MRKLNVVIFVIFLQCSIVQGVLPEDGKSVEVMEPKIEAAAKISEIYEVINNQNTRAKEIQEKWINIVRKDFVDVFYNYTSINSSMPNKETNRTQSLKSFLDEYEVMVEQANEHILTMYTLCVRICKRYAREAENIQKNIEKTNDGGDFKTMNEYLKKLDDEENKVKTFIEEFNSEMEDRVNSTSKKFTEYFRNELKQRMLANTAELNF